MSSLDKLFGSPARVKIMRLFLSNPEGVFEVSDVAGRSKVTSTICRRELSNLEKIGLIKKRTILKELKTQHKSSTKSRKKKRRVHLDRKRVYNWTLNERFEYLEPLQGLLIRTSPVQNSEIVSRISHATGKLKLVIISGVFLQNWDSRVDLLVVGDHIKTTALDHIVKNLESEVGREIRYASFETADFLYRVGVYDKLIRDILDFEHEKILDKIGLIELKPKVL